MSADVRSSNTLRVLMLEDTVWDAELCEHELRTGGLPISVRRVDNREDFEEALERDRPAIILSDFSMPRFDGLSALDIAREKSPHIPFIFVSGTIGEERAVEAMRRGATDYVLKDHLSRLVPVVKRALEERDAREALDETRGQLEGVLRSLCDVVWSFALEPLRFLYVNDATQTLYGRPAAEFFANPQLAFEVMHPADRPHLMALWERATVGEGFDTEHRIVRPDGSLRWVHVRGKPITDAAGKVTRIDGIVRDVTERRSHEDRIARLSRVRMVLSGIDAVMLRVHEREALFVDACHIAVRHGGFKLAWVGAVDPVSGRVQPSVRCGEESECLERAITSAPGGAYDESLADLAVRTAKLAFSNDLASDERVCRIEDCLRSGYHSAAVVPLRSGQRVVATLALYAEEAGFFDEEERRLLEQLSDNISFALDYMDKSSRLDYLAYYDALTGLPNRQLFFDRLAQLVSHATHEDERVALIVVDIARFRSVNETMGTAAGDAVLIEIAARLTKRSTGCARVAADRFAVTLSDGAHNSGSVSLAADHLLDDLDAPIRVGEQDIRVQVRAGIALCPEDGESAPALFANAEAALRNAKASGERVRFYAREMNARVAELLQLEHELSVAVREQQFVLFYQPRVSLGSGRICGFEALLRWMSPSRGLVPPCQFVPLLEEMGFILDVGRWALEQAATEAEQWRSRGLSVPPIGVNVSAVQLRERDFVAHVRKAISAHPRADAIELELTESMVMADVEANARKLAEVREAGVRIAIDDFGTGYSSLAYLASLPLDALKIDRSFVSSMRRSAVHRAIVTTIISLARSLGLRSVAEGVEAPEEAALLRRLGCEQAQGYLYGKPVPASRAAALLGPEGPRSEVA